MNGHISYKQGFKFLKNIWTTTLGTCCKGLINYVILPYIHITIYYINIIYILYICMVRKVIKKF